MSYDNVPDDWNSYWYTCECGQQWHGSEGGCTSSSCDINAERKWLYDSGYDYSDGTWSKLIVARKHVCRRNHKNGRIKVGQAYIRYTSRHIDDETGESWLGHRIKRI